MQGRLSPLVDGKFQTFPWDRWRDEFSIANGHAFKVMEWILDQDRLYENPCMTEDGQVEIRDLSHKYEISISSLTGDCFMNAPFYKVDGFIASPYYLIFGTSLYPVENWILNILYSH